MRRRKTRKSMRNRSKYQLEMRRKSMPKSMRKTFENHQKRQKHRNHQNPAHLFQARKPYLCIPLSQETTPMGPSKPELKNWKKMKKVESDGTISNDMESTQVAPRDPQKLEFWRNSKFFNFWRNSQNSMSINAFDSKWPYLSFFDGREGRNCSKIGCFARDSSTPAYYT